MQRPGLILCTEDLVRRVERALYGSPSLKTMLGLMRQLNALNRLLASYNLGVPIGGLGDDGTPPGLAADRLSRRFGDGQAAGTDFVPRASSSWDEGDWSRGSSLGIGSSRPGDKEPGTGERIADQIHVVTARSRDEPVAIHDSQSVSTGRESPDQSRFLQDSPSWPRGEGQGTKRKVSSPQARPVVTVATQPMWTESSEEGSAGPTRPAIQEGSVQSPSVIREAIQEPRSLLSEGEWTNRRGRAPGQVRLVAFSLPKAHLVVGSESQRLGVAQAPGNKGSQGGGADRGRPESQVGDLRERGAKRDVGHELGSPPPEMGRRWAREIISEQVPPLAPSLPQSVAVGPGSGSQARSMDGYEPDDRRAADAPHPVEVGGLQLSLKPRRPAASATGAVQKRPVPSRSPANMGARNQVDRSYRTASTAEIVDAILPAGRVAEPVEGAQGDPDSNGGGDLPKPAGGEPWVRGSRREFIQATSEGFGGGVACALHPFPAHSEPTRPGIHSSRVGKFWASVEQDRSEPTEQSLAQTVAGRRDEDGQPHPDEGWVFTAPEGDLNWLAEQIERLLRDEARRHGIEF